MHANIAEDHNLIVFTDQDGKIVDCFEFQRLSFIGSLKNLFREEKIPPSLDFIFSKKL